MADALVGGDAAELAVGDSVAGAVAAALRLVWTVRYLGFEVPV